MYRAGRTLFLLQFLPAKTLVVTASRDHADLLNARLAKLGRKDITVKVIEPKAQGVRFDLIEYNEADILEKISG